MTENAWCNNGQTQIKIALAQDGRFLIEEFALQTDGSRGAKQGEAGGAWSVENNNTIVYTVDGQATKREGLRLDPNGQAGGKEMIIGTPPQTTTYVPCN